ncbi:MAG: sulfurtransferase [Actinomycetaceae bacterium]|nr:sulfurtransferase [Actinomycetaceae bacterium]
MTDNVCALISVSDLARIYRDDTTVVLDATMGATSTDPHIPGAQIAAIEGPWSDEESPWPHTRPDRDALEYELRRLGINADSRVIVYEHDGLFSAPRIWWLLRYAGISTAAILDGGLVAWEAAHLPVTREKTSPRPSGTVKVIPRDEMIIDEHQVRQHVAKKDRQIFDARSTERFQGTVAEPRPGLRSGHIPTSRSLPYTTVQRNGFMLPEDELHEILEPLLDDRPIVTTCGSGVTACVIALALNIMGRTDVAVYDGSWSQWGREGGPEIETGPESK